MRVQGHIAGGFLSAGMCVSAIRPAPQVADWLLFVGAFSGALPDLDALYYLIKKPRSANDEDFRHHTWPTHTFPFYVVPGLAVLGAARILGFAWLQWGVVVFLAGTCMHLVQDMFGSGDGIMLFYPFSKRMFGIELTRSHGRSWLLDYRRTRSFLFERVLILVAAAVLCVYIVVRVWPGPHA